MLDLTNAPCRDRPELAPGAGDEPPTPRLTREKCGPALRLCAACPLRAQCIAHVRPHKCGFTGVCGGRLWFDGQIIGQLATAHHSELPAPVNRKACGSAAGARAHRRAVEQQCDNCASFHARYLASISDTPALIGGEQLSFGDLT
ncbi:hypothetical protein [Streptomyces spiramyceticus]|uniref:hypothetical protein n=1 Tax=Streptomyces spiramyceticus TaxID=299717 RepID=UPI00237A60FA|nr:hypothetical protein [Streptomyces spiramyceticus]